MVGKLILASVFAFVTSVPLLLWIYNSDVITSVYNNSLVDKFGMEFSEIYFRIIFGVYISSLTIMLLNAPGLLSLGNNRAANTILTAAISFLVAQISISVVEVLAGTQTNRLAIERRKNWVSLDAPDNLMQGQYVNVRAYLKRNVTEDEITRYVNINRDNGPVNPRTEPTNKIIADPYKTTGGKKPVLFAKLTSGGLEVSPEEQEARYFSRKSEYVKWVWHVGIPGDKKLPLGGISLPITLTVDVSTSSDDPKIRLETIEKNINISLTSEESASRFSDLITTTHAAAVIVGGIFVSVIGYVLRSKRHSRHTQ